MDRSSKLRTRPAAKPHLNLALTQVPTSPILGTAFQFTTQRNALADPGLIFLESEHVSESADLVNLKLTAATSQALSRRRRIALWTLDNLVWVILGIALAGFSIGIHGFFSAENFENIVSHSVFLAVLVIPVTYILIVGQLDISVGAVASFGALLSAWLAGASANASGLLVNPFVTLAIVLGCAGAVGLVNGLAVTKLHISSFLVTLSTMMIVQGLTLMLTEGNGVALLPPEFRWIETTQLAGVPLTVFVVLGIFVACHFILQATQFGRHLFVIGGNSTAAYNFGIRVDALVIRLFIFSGVLAGLTGWLLSARLNGANPTVGSTLLFDALAAVVIGGVSLTGGVGSLTGVLAGVLLLGAVSSALDILVVSPFAVQVLRGSLVLGAIVLDSVKRRFT